MVFQINTLLFSLVRIAIEIIGSGREIDGVRSLVKIPSISKSSACEAVHSNSISPLSELVFSDQYCQANLDDPDLPRVLALRIAFILPWLHVSSGVSLWLLALIAWNADLRMLTCDGESLDDIQSGKNDKPVEILSPTQFSLGSKREALFSHALGILEHLCIASVDTTGRTARVTSCIVPYLQEMGGNYPRDFACNILIKLASFISWDELGVAISTEKLPLPLQDLYSVSSGRTSSIWPILTAIMDDRICSPFLVNVNERMPNNENEHIFRPCRAVQERLVPHVLQAWTPVCRTLLNQLSDCSEQDKAFDDITDDLNQEKDLTSSSEPHEKPAKYDWQIMIRAGLWLSRILLSKAQSCVIAQETSSFGEDHGSEEEEDKGRDGEVETPNAIGTLKSKDISHIIGIDPLGKLRLVEEVERVCQDCLVIFSRVGSSLSNLSAVSISLSQSRFQQVMQSKLTEDSTSKECITSLQATCMLHLSLSTSLQNRPQEAKLHLQHAMRLTSSHNGTSPFYSYVRSCPRANMDTGSFSPITPRCICESVAFVCAWIESEMGRLCWTQNQISSALSHFRNALQHAKLAGALRKQINTPNEQTSVILSDLLKLFESSMSLCPLFSSLTGWIGGALSQLGGHDDAIQALEEGLNGYPSFPSTPLSLFSDHGKSDSNARHDVSSSTCIDAEAKEVQLRRNTSRSSFARLHGLPPSQREQISESLSDNLVGKELDDGQSSRKGGTNQRSSLIRRNSAKKALSHTESPYAALAYHDVARSKSCQPQTRAQSRRKSVSEIPARNHPEKVTQDSLLQLQSKRSLCTLLQPSTNVLMDDHERIRQIYLNACVQSIFTRRSQPEMSLLDLQLCANLLSMKGLAYTRNRLWNKASGSYCDCHDLRITIEQWLTDQYDGMQDVMVLFSFERAILLDQIGYVLFDSGR